MRYFLLKADRHFVDVPRVQNWYQQTGIFRWEAESYQQLPKRILLMVRNQKQMVFPELLFDPMLLVREPLKMLLQKYEPNLEFKECILMNREQRQEEIYFLPSLPEIKEMKTVVNDGITETFWRLEDIKDCTIFAVGYVENYFSIVVRFDVIESMLRRNADGFTMKEIIVKGGGDRCQEVVTLNI